MSDDFHWVMAAIDGGEEFRDFGGPLAACEEYVAARPAVAGQTRAYRIVADA